MNHISPKVLRQMYASTKQVEYPEYCFHIEWKDGRRKSIRFNVESGKTPYEFFMGLFKNSSTRDVLKAVLYRHGDYMESFNPEDGWSKEGGDAMLA